MADQENDIFEIGANHFLAALPVAAILLDSRRKIAAANQLARDTLNITTPGTDLSASIRNPSLLNALDNTLSTGEGSVCEMRAGTAPPLIYEVHASPLEHDGARHAIVVFMDVSSARQADAMRSTFVANVSHELRSPLTTLMGAAEALEGPSMDDPEGRARMLALMGQEARRMKNLIDDLLSLSRVEAQEFIPPGQKVDLRPLLEGARDRLAERAAAREMTIKLNVHDGLPLIPGLDSELFQVFDNLISNAIKYGARASIVTVIAELADDSVRVSIHNEGDPIPPEHLPRLTERFYRVDKSRSRELGGTGLGLAIIKHIVSRHRGSILIESCEDAGTIFSVLLPLAS